MTMAAQQQQARKTTTSKKNVATAGQTVNAFSDEHKVTVDVESCSEIANSDTAEDAPSPTDKNHAMTDAPAETCHDASPAEDTTMLMIAGNLMPHCLKHDPEELKKKLDEIDELLKPCKEENLAGGMVIPPTQHQITLWWQLEIFGAMQE